MRLPKIKILKLTTTLVCFHSHKHIFYLHKTHLETLITDYIRESVNNAFEVITY